MTSQDPHVHGPAPVGDSDVENRGPAYGGGLAGTLLADVWANALDPGYAAAARRRPPVEPSGTRRLAALRGSARAALVLGLVGVLVAVAAAQVRQNLSSSGLANAALLKQVHATEIADDHLQAEADTLRGAVSAARSKLLATSAAGSAVDRVLAALELAGAATAVSGPGVEVRLSDAATGSPLSGNGATVESGAVTDRDLQSLVNALWAAGADAISVDGERIGPQTAIRTAGQAVLVNFRPVTSPYLIDAIGPTNALETGLAASRAGQQLQTLSSVYGIGFTVHTEGHLRLASATSVAPTAARPLAAGAR